MRRACLLAGFGRTKCRSIGSEKGVPTSNRNASALSSLKQEGLADLLAYAKRLPARGTLLFKTTGLRIQLDCEARGRASWDVNMGASPMSLYLTQIRDAAMIVRSLGLPLV